MKNTWFVILLFSLSLLQGAHAQPAQGFQYQCVVRDADGVALADRQVTLRFSILQKNAGQPGADYVPVYAELHEATADANGLVRAVIGGGAPLQGSFETIEWAKGDVLLRTEADPDGTGTFRFVSEQKTASVPYAFAAGQAVQLVSSDGTRWGLLCDNDGKLQTMPVPERFSRLVFQDEFDGTGLPDETKWSYEEGYVRNGEEQYYTVARKENCYLQDGCLHIVCRHDSAKIENALIDKQWETNYNATTRRDTVIPITSASIRTYEKFAFTYGRVEVRAKLPVCLGSWPAIWLYPHDGEYGYWPNSGEIDIMEHVGYSPESVHFTLHSSRWNGNNQPNRYANSSPIDDATAWHVYALEWHPDRISWFVDGELQTTVQKGANYTWAEWPFDKDFYLILNLAFGGGWGGREGIDTDALPQEYVIDYVRIYR